MRKVYLGLFSIAVTSMASAQVNTSIVSIKQSRSDNFKAVKQVSALPKAEGDVVWSNNFTTAADWTAGTNPSGTPPHTAGAWAIVNAMPASLTSQAPTYGFPTTIGSASGGNFALINSDAAGATATQNAWIENTTNIALADALTANGSAANAAIYLKFNEVYRHFQDKNFVQISNDGGATWTTFAVNPVSEVPVNTNSSAPEIEVVNITSAIGGGNWTNQVKVRFLYTGNYDWFWGVDDVQLVEAYANDAKFTGVFQATPLANTQGLDYYRVPLSQTSFPGITFGALALNNGGATQNNVTLKATGPSYTQTSAATTLVPGAIDTLEITTPFMIPATVGSSVVNVTTDLGVTDGDPSNNQRSMTFVRDQYLYGRDNNTPTGSIAQVQSQDGLELKIGNIMEIFDNMTLTGIQVRLMNQPLAVGQEVNCTIELFNSGNQEFEYIGETVYHEIQDGDLGTFITIPMDGGNLQLNAGDVILVMAHHLGGANEVAFAYAQPTEEGTVLGYAANGDRFRLTTPNAIMIRLSEDLSLSVNENLANVNVAIYPNPVVGEATVEVNGATASAISVIDVTGKVVYTTNASEGTSKVSFSTANFSAGIYTVNVSTSAGTVTKKMVVKN